MSIDQQAKNQRKRRVHHFPMLKQRGKKIVVVTAYDYPTGMAADLAGADAILVGDSLGMVALGYGSTIPVTVDIMVHHTAAVSRAVKSAFLIADMPFMSYKVSPEQALETAGRLVQEGGAEAVKLEGGEEVAAAIARVTAAGIPVMGHVGLLPQSVHLHGGYRVQGRDEETVGALIAAARAVEDAGAFSVVLEAVDPDVAARITASLRIPTIGIGAGRQCDGQVLVISDLAGMLPGDRPKFVRQYASLFDSLQQAVRAYADDVRSGVFPAEGHEY